MAWDGDKQRWCPHATSGQRRSTGCPTLWRWYWSSRFAAGHLCIQFLWQHDGIGVNELPMNLYKCARNCDLICFDCISYYENSLQNLQCQNDFETLGIALPVNWIEKCNFPGCSGRLLAVPFLNSANGFSLFVCFSIVQTERSELH